MKSILVVGGGTTGLISALILKQRFPEKEVNIVKSEKVGILGVGEAATEHWKSFMDYVGISYKEVIKKADATIKYAVKFSNFNKEDYFHNTTVPLADMTLISQYHAGYAYHISNKDSQYKTIDKCVLDGTMLKSFLDNDECPTNQFHFNTFKLNDYLTELCLNRNIKIITDDITNCVYSSNGSIESLTGEKDNYDYDFYIDCSGFGKIVINKLGAEWKSYRDYLKMNEAIAFPTNDTDDYPLYTNIRGMKSGWMWNSPVFGRYGNGYVYDNDYMNAEEAQKEVEQTLGKEVKIAKNVKFEPGCLKKSWIKNCVAVGLSSSFVEPMEASTISVSINQIFLLMHYLENYSEKDIEDYNNKTTSIMENLRDFIFIHYMVDRKDTSFWKSVQNLEQPDSLKERLSKWKHRLPIAEDFTDTDYHIFKPANWINVMYGLNMFNVDKIKKEYLSYSETLRNHIEDIIKSQFSYYNQTRIGHKEYLNKIRGTL